MSTCELTFKLTMAPRTRNKKKTKHIMSPMTGDDFGRPPGLATTIAGPSLAPMPAPNQHRCSLCHQNDDGTTDITHNSDTCQVDHNPPRFEIIESDDESEDHTMSSEELELEEAPPVDEAMPTTLQQPIATSSPMVPTVSTTSVNDKFFKKLSKNILLGMNTAFERNHESELSMMHMLLGSLEQQAQGNEEHQQVLVQKLDEMKTKIFSTIVSELMGMCTDIDHMNTLHKASTDIFFLLNYMVYQPHTGCWTFHHRHDNPLANRQTEINIPNTPNTNAPSPTKR